MVVKQYSQNYLDVGLVNSIGLENNILIGGEDDMEIGNNEFTVYNEVQNILSKNNITYSTEDSVISNISYTIIERNYKNSNPSESVLADVANKILEVVDIATVEHSQPLYDLEGFSNELGEFLVEPVVAGGSGVKDLSNLKSVANKIIHLPYLDYLIPFENRSKDSMPMFENYRNTVEPVVFVPIEKSDVYKQKLLQLELDNQNKTPVQRIREENGIEIWEIADKLGKTIAQYKYFENRQGRKDSRLLEKSIQLTYQAITEITKDRQRRKNTAFSSMKPNVKGVVEEILVYPPFTNQLFNKAVKCIQDDKMNIVKTAMLLGICDLELKTRLENSEYFYLVDIQDNY